MTLKFSKKEALTAAIVIVVGIVYAFASDMPSISGCGVGVMTVSMAVLFFGGFIYLVMQYGQGKRGGSAYKPSTIDKLGGFLKRNALPLLILCTIGFVLALMKI